MSGSVPSLPSQCLGAPTRSVLAAPPGHLPLSRTQAVAPASFALVLPSFPLPTQQLPLDGSVQCSHQQARAFGWGENLVGGLGNIRLSELRRPHVGSFRGSITQPIDSLSTLRVGVTPAHARLAFGPLARLCPIGAFTRWTPSLSFGCSTTSSSQPTVILAQSEVKAGTRVAPTGSERGASKRLTCGRVVILSRLEITGGFL